MNSPSPAHSSVSTTAVVGVGIGGASSNSALEEFSIPYDLIRDYKDQAMLTLKADVMAALNKEVKSLDEDNWMFEGPRSRIHLISKSVSSQSYGAQDRRVSKQEDGNGKKWELGPFQMI
ncbi:hypothetical protein Tsubulata_042716 [Turnera subulata]|uniref:Uncharacterized protein n=1 Tax=Turnera subulata TaxID=218843 RepID=A0A9Q0JFW4_9ROSI|nr:hypothetical protein Tsubulata_042716 [Turnera subulata]